MTYETAFERLEECLDRMSKDLQKYAESDNASQRAVDTRLNIINTIIDYLNLADEQVTDLKWELLQEQMKYSKLHADTHRLVLFCKLHNINPNMVFHYTKDELAKLLVEGFRFQAPTIDLSKIIYGSGGQVSTPKLADELNIDAKLQAYENKYLSLKQFSHS